MTTPTADLDRLYRARADRVDLVEVPELGCLIVDGVGAPDGARFADAVAALYTVTYGLHFRIKRRDGDSAKIRPLEALWWVDGPPETWAATPREHWRWRALIVQPDAVAEDDVATVVAAAERKKPLPGLARLRFLRWREGRCAQVLHVGPYADEPATVARLHDGIRAEGLQPAGRHHEIYLSDPRRTAPERLRTILRQAVSSG